ncbi:YciI family protein [uncultured Gilvimarinus sp.]|uniref:YciI family protein n=1 Tax=uncultured Gilvimarinus sp. TaxID=1689143 RepID=UPI0030EBBD43|tara:strand:+ start:535 stop:849 length:315 start_codon:yes stop_codon:yes gene_type:complete
MRFLCLAFGDKDGWISLSDDEKTDVLAQDSVITGGGATVVAVRPEVTSVRNWGKHLEVSDGPHQAGLPLAGFYIIEAESAAAVVERVANTPCARARGVIEIHPF